jgi:hypothetical protein
MLTDKQITLLPKVCKQCPAANQCYLDDEAKKPMCMNYSREAREAIQHESKS